MPLPDVHARPRLQALTLTATMPRHDEICREILQIQPASLVDGCHGAIEAMRKLLRKPYELLVVDLDAARSSTPVLLRHATHFTPRCAVLVFDDIPAPILHVAYEVLPRSQTAAVLTAWMRTWHASAGTGHEP